MHVHKDKSIFKLEELPVQRFAESLGLPGAPKIKFLNKEIAKRKKNASHIVSNMSPQASSSKVANPDEESDSSGGEDLSEHSSSEEEETRPARALDEHTTEKVRCIAAKFADRVVLTDDFLAKGSHKIRPHVRAQEPRYSVRALLETSRP